jgi:RsiW-degrading membrane proteinase PrsW (M82 family)
MLSMSGLWVLVLLIFISSVPAIAVYIWFRVTRYPLSLVHFLCSLLAGAAAFFPALLLQNLFPAPGTVWTAGKWGLFFQTFLRIALTEELSRFIALSVLFGISARLAAAKSCAPVSSPVSYSHVMQGSAAGLTAGLGFAILESAAYGASDAGLTLLRAFTAAPLHGACGSRIGAAAALLRQHPPQAVFRFLSAVAIHGVYNFMIVRPGFPSITAVLIAFSALISSILAIQSGRQTPPQTRPGALD